MRLSELVDNEKGVITYVRGRGAFRKRLTEMGFVKGQVVKVIKNAPLKDPIEYEIMGYKISLRREEAQLINVVDINEFDFNDTESYNGIIDEKTLKKSLSKNKNEINIAFVGNPNCGKTTLFNNISGAHEHVGNYSGVTVESQKKSRSYKNYRLNLIDLPGTYSLTTYTPEELYVRNFIFDEVPDIVINVIDSSNLERNLFLTTQLIDMDIKVVVALNMYDELQKNGDLFDYKSLGKMIGVPMIPTIGSKGKGINKLLEKVVDVFEDNDKTVRHIHINYGKELENSISKIQEKLKTKNNEWLLNKISSRFIAIKLLEKDNDIKQRISDLDNYNEIINVSNQRIKKLETAFNEKSENLITDMKYGFIKGALKETYKSRNIKNIDTSKIIDIFLTHKFLGIPIFIFFLWLMFFTTFNLGAYPVSWIESGVEILSNFIKDVMPNGMFKDLLVDGIIGGVGGVIVFLPNILLLFLFISIMEDSGYMARAAFIIDKLMHKIGLHGKSFIPLIMGFGCNVPAIMATRTLENKSDRIITILINPFMSCSARLPVFILLTSAFFPNNAGNMIFIIYITGIIIAAVTAILLRKTIFKKQETPFVMELPPYRMPNAKTTLIHMWHKSKQYLTKMGGIILIASIIIWALGYFPKNINYSINYDKNITNIQTKYNKIIANNKTDSITLTKLATQKNSSILELKKIKEIERQKKTYIGKIGLFIQPVMKPLGFDWRMSISLLSGIAAKEIVVSTLGVLYQSDGTVPLKDKLKENFTKNSDKNGIAKLRALSFIIFILVYFPCIAVVSAVKNETGSWKWATFMIIYTTSLAWLLAFATFQIGKFFI